MSQWKNKFDWKKIKDDIDKERSKKKSWQDDRIWKQDWKAAVEREEFYTFRFLPDQDGNPFVKYFTHNFDYEKDGTKKFYINNCISTFGWDPACPICAKVKEYYDSAFESDQDLAKDRKRSVNFVSNILMIDDPINPDNNGKVFLYRYGVKIFAKIEKLLFPSEKDLKDEDFEPFIPFDLYDGANFKLKVEMQGDFPNYDNSSWSKRGPVGKDNEIDAIMEKVYSLNEFIDPTKYPSVKDTLQQVGHLLGAPTAESESEEDDDDDNSSISNFAEEPKDETPEKAVAPEQAEPDSEPEQEAEPETGDDADDSADDPDDDEAFFKNLT
jgi:hypothetical protein